MTGLRPSAVLDIRARYAAAVAIDNVKDEWFNAKLTPARNHMRSWNTAVPGLVAVAGGAGTEFACVATVREPRSGLGAAEIGKAPPIALIE